MRIWRIEAEDGMGPYRGPAKDELTVMQKAGIYHSTSTQHPNVQMSFTQRVKDNWYAYMNYRFGFTSKRQMLRWFEPHELERLCECGARVMIYEVPDEHVIKGRKQCIFNPDKAKRKGETKP
jgi:hypothetical protein